MTTLNVTLSTALQNELDQPGVNAYAVYFDSNGANPTWTPLVSNGSVENSGTTPITLPSTMKGGKIYFLVQSVDPSQTGSDNLQNLITTESQISTGTAGSYDFAYDSFEVTLQNTANDAGNLTSVNGFGLPMEVSVPYSDGTTATVGYGISGDSVVGDINTINPSTILNYTSGPLAGSFRMAVSPTTSVAGSVATPPFVPSDWASYVQSLEGPQAETIVLSGEFNGAPDAANVWHNGGYYAYQLQWDGADFLLVPLASSQIEGVIALTPGDLENSIYSTLGEATIYPTVTNAENATNAFLTMNTGANNQWGKVLAELLVGFSAGYFGEMGKSPNPQVTTAIDLGQNINESPIYAFGQNLSTTPPAYQAYDRYSQIFFTNTNSYGSGYSDLLMSNYTAGGPLISVSNPASASVDPGKNVSDINLTIFADGETPAPPTAHGYTVPTINDYIAPAAGGYVAPSIVDINNDIVLDFATSVPDNAGLVLASTDTITLSILTSDAKDTPVWSTVTLDGATTDHGLWQVWTISGSPSDGYTAATSDQLKPAGTLLINGFPTADTGVSWYQIDVAPGTAGSKTFNLYTTTSGGSFENPNYTGQQGALAIDGLAEVAPPQSTAQTLTTFNVNFSVGDTVALDPSLLVANSAANDTTLTPPDAPVAGTLSGDAFTALAGQTNPTSNTIATTDSAIAFGWTGENNGSGAATSTWISAYTNKIDSSDVALVTITSGGFTSTTSATANLDGDWQTGAVDLANGTYTVTMQEFLPGDTAFADPLTLASEPLKLTVSSTGMTPTATVSVDSSNVNVANNTATVTFTFSEAPTSFSLADTSTVGGTLSNLSGTGTSYTATFTGASNTNISSGAATVLDSSWNVDGNVNPGRGATSSAFVVDTVTPTVAVSVNSSLVTSTATVSFIFSEAPTSFSLADTSAVGGSLSNLAGSGTYYTATFTAAPDTDITSGSVSVTSGNWQDRNGNLGAPGMTSAFAIDTTTSGGTTITISSGTTVISTAIPAGTNYVVEGGGALEVVAGGTVSGLITVGSAGSAVVLSGGTASAGVVSSGAELYIGSGGTAAGAQIEGGGAEVVFGSDSGASLSGTQYDFGSASGGITYNGGYQLVAPGAVANSMTVAYGGQQYVGSGGTTLDAQVASGGAEVVFGSDSGASLSGTQYLYGIAYGGAAYANGYQLVASGAIASDMTVESGGEQYIGSGGTAIATNIAPQGAQVVFGSALDAAVSGTQYDFVYASGGTTYGGGFQQVAPNAVASAMTVLSGGQQYIGSGGSAIATNIGSQGAEVVFGADSGAQISGTQYDFGTATGGTTFNGGFQFVAPDGAGTAIGMTVLSGGEQYVNVGGTASGTQLTGHGIEVVRGTDLDATVSGTQFVSGLASGTVVATGGYQQVEAGGTVSGASISGGTIELMSGGSNGTAPISFTGAGELILDASTSFSGTVAGFGATDSIDLADIPYVASAVNATTVSWMPSGSASGTLMVAEGGHAADIVLLGQYSGNFTPSAGGNGTLVTYAPAQAMTDANPQALAMTPHP